MSVILYVGKGGLAGDLVRIKVGFEVADGKYALDDDLR